MLQDVLSCDNRRLSVVIEDVDPAAIEGNPQGSEPFRQRRQDIDVFVWARHLPHGVAQLQICGFGIVRIPTMIWIDSADYNRFLKVISEIDTTMVVGVLLSFLAVILGFDGVSSERERGTMKLVLANAVPRSQVIIAKLVGGVTSLWVPLALAYVVSLLALLNNPDVTLITDDWVRLFGMFLLS